MEIYKNEHRILLEGSKNTRDLGGYGTGDGGVLRNGLLFRSGELSQITGEDRRILFEELGIRTIIDLRTIEEREEKAEIDQEGIRLLHHPILDEGVAGITKEEETKATLFEELEVFLSHGIEAIEGFMRNMYTDFIRNPYACSQIGHFLDLILEQESPVLWHCASGKDRVGITTAVLLTVLGVERERIIQDYLQTAEYVTEDTERMLASIGEKRFDPLMEQGIRIMNGVKADWIGSCFTEMERECGSVDEFITQRMGITPTKKELLRQKYVTNL